MINIRGGQFYILNVLAALNIASTGGGEWNLLQLQHFDRLWRLAEISEEIYTAFW
jgi:hypothetical protein